MSGRLYPGSLTTGQLRKKASTAAAPGPAPGGRSGEERLGDAETLPEALTALSGGRPLHPIITDVLAVIGVLEAGFIQCRGHLRRQ